MKLKNFFFRFGQSYLGGREMGCIVATIGTIGIVASMVGWVCYNTLFWKANLLTFW